MKTLMLIIALLAFCGCQSVDTKNTVAFYQDSSTFDVVCEDSSAPKQNVAHYDVRVVSHMRDSTGAVTKDGQRLYLSKSSCLLERNESLEPVPESTRISRKFTFECKVGQSQFVDHDLQILDQEHDVLIFRKTNGKVWVLPKNLCTISAN